MAVTIDATVGGASANSYATLAEANAAMEARLNSDAWDDASDDSKTRALVEAQKEFQHLAWKGSRVDATQALAWPRAYVPNPDAPFDAEALSLSDVVYLAQDAIPSRVKQAQIELAFQFLVAGDVDLALLDDTDGVVEKTVDVLTTKYADPAYRATTWLEKYPRIAKALSPLLATSAGGLTVVRS